MKSKTQKKNYFIDSAGTSGLHAGEMSDQRMIFHAKKRGYDLTGTSRQLTKEDIKHFDLILTMDESNYKNTLLLCTADIDRKKIKPFTSFCRKFDITAVPDPYYGGDEGFEKVIDILEDGIQNLLNEF